MLEFILFALFSDTSGEFLGQMEEEMRRLPRIEVLEPAKVPLKIPKKVAPKILDDKRTAVLAFDENAGRVLFSQNENRAQPIASLSKIMSFLVIYENHDLDEEVSIPLSATKIEGAKADLYHHERLTVGALLEAILIPSANDAMVALALYDSGTEQVFAKKMNEKARGLGLRSAEFFNSTGLDILDEETGEVHGNKMSASDILQLVRIALNNDFFRETVGKKTFSGTSVDERFFHEKKSTNELLGTFLKSKGVKTGYTEHAGECLVNLSETADGSEILTVILGSRDRFGETKNLVTWIMDSFVWR